MSKIRATSSDLAKSLPSHASSTGANRVQRDICLALSYEMGEWKGPSKGNGEHALPEHCTDNPNAPNQVKPPGEVS